MKSNREGSVSLIAWSIGGFVLSVVALFGIFGGLILGLLMVAATPFVIGFLVIEAFLGRKPVYVTSWKSEEALSDAVQEESHRKVAMQILERTGPCRLGYELAAGSTWTLNGKLEGPVPMCPQAYRVLKDYAREAQDLVVDDREMTLLCGNGHSVDLGLWQVESEVGSAKEASHAMA